MQNTSFMKMPSLLATTSCLWLGLITALPLQAHSVWIEPLPDGQLALRFGEWGEEPETSPGHLDSLIEPSTAVQRGGTTIPVEVTKSADHYLLTGTKAADSATGKSDYAVMKRGEGPGRRPIFYARWWPAHRPEVTVPAGMLDLMPSVEKPGQVLVSFQGKAVAAGVELIFYAPGTEGVKLLTDASGQVTVPEALNAGLCLLTLGRFSEDAPGEFQGKAYAIASHSASLCWRVEKTSQSK
jgi:hypothetical protein